MVRHDSWAAEMEEELQKRQREEEDNEHNMIIRERDRRQWTQGIRGPSDWAQGLASDVRTAGEKASNGNTCNTGLHNSKWLERKNVAGDNKHKCGKDGKTAVRHWFGDSDVSGSESSEDDSGWSTVDREMKNRQRKRRSKERKSRKMAEVTSKARNMAGLGPITD